YSGSQAAATEPPREHLIMADNPTDPAAAEPPSLNLKVGDTAPDVSLPEFPSGTFNLADYRGKKTVVLYFYPKDDTPGCTKEACAFRDTHDDFAQADAVIFGVSQDSLESHKAFAGKFNIPFPLLVDEGDAVRKEFGMPDPQAPLHARVT